MPEAQQQPVRVCHLFVDESGDHAFNRLDCATHRFLGLFGVWFSGDAYAAFDRKLRNLKSDIFGDSEVILHREDMINRRGVFERLGQENTRQRFDKGLLDLVRGADFYPKLVVIDKSAIPESNRQRFNPYHRALATLLDRYTEWLQARGMGGTVTAETRGNPADTMLEDEYRRAYKRVCHDFACAGQAMPPTSASIKLEPKRANTAGLQLADILAHPCKKGALQRAGILPRNDSTFGKMLFDLVDDKLNEARESSWTFIA